MRKGNHGVKIVMLVGLLTSYCTQLCPKETETSPVPRKENVSPAPVMAPQIFDETKIVEPQVTGPKAILEPKEGDTLVIFGDSMVGSGFGQNLTDLAKEKGMKVAWDSWVSSRTDQWAGSSRLENLLNKKPVYVIVVLGTNELGYPSVQARAKYVKKIVNRLGGNCIWVGPPSWDKYDGAKYNEMLSKTVEPCIFFDSTKLKIERQSDHIHPTINGGKWWSERVWDYLTK